MGSLVSVDKGHVVTSVLNTREEVEMPSREVQVIELGENDSREVARMASLIRARTKATTVVVGQREW